MEQNLFVEKDMEWFEEQDLLDPDLIQFEEVRLATGNVEISGQDFTELLNDESAVGLVVEGNLTVLGPISVDEQHAVFVSGAVKCDSFGIYASPFSAAELHVENFIHFGESNDQMMETWDCNSLKAKVVVVPDADELPVGLQANHIIEEPEEYGPVLESMLEDNFAAVFAALEKEIPINDEWISANAALCTNTTMRNKHLGSS